MSQNAAVPTTSLCRAWQASLLWWRAAGSVLGSTPIIWCQRLCAADVAKPPCLSALQCSNNLLMPAWLPLHAHGPHWQCVTFFQTLSGELRWTIFVPSPLPKLYTKALRLLNKISVDDATFASKEIQAYLKIRGDFRHQCSIHGMHKAPWRHFVT